MGRGIVEAQTLRSEQFEFEARTTDPADAQPGEYWIRTDQTGTNPDIIAQLRREDNSGVTTCPIFAAAEESNLGADVVRGPSVVLDGGSVGFVAMTTKGGAVGSPRAVNSAGTQYVSHNALELSPIPDSAVDNFEPVLYEEQSRTLSDYYNDVGNTAASTVQRQQTTVLEDSYSLEIEGNDSAAQVISTGTADLPNTPVQGDSFRVKLRGTATSSIPAFQYGVQSSDSHYELRLRIPNDSIDLLKDGAEQSSTAATLSQSTTYDPTLQWAGDGQQTLTLNDDGGVDQSVSFTDTAYTSGEVGWFVTRSEFISPAMIGDHARII